MKVAILNRSDLRGGAAVVSYRLMEALRAEGVDARMLVVEKLSKNPRVEKMPAHFGGKLPFLQERLGIYLANGRRREDLFKVDTAAYGLPVHRHPLVAEADVVCLNWVNQGMVSLREIGRIAEMRKPIVWTMHDMWNLTGICHHAGACRGYRGECGNCRFLDGRASAGDLSHRTWLRKRRLYGKVPMKFVAVSNWLRDKCLESKLLGDADVRVIPNAFHLPDFDSSLRLHDGRVRVLVAAARLDDDVKGLPLLLGAARWLRENASQTAARIELTAVGALKDADALKDMALDYKYLGAQPYERMPQLFGAADMVVSSSLYETLPGTLVEAQAYGALPVAFDRGGQRDIVRDGHDGVLTSFGGDDAESAANLGRAVVRGVEMLDAMPSEELRRRLYDSVAGKFSSHIVARKYMEVFEEMK